jgi:cysteine synthase A
MSVKAGGRFVRHFSSFNHFRSISLLDSIGNTPLVELKRINESNRSSAKIFAKLEFLNPSGSIKDRMVSFAIEQAEKRAELKEGATIIEATSGNTGVALSMVSAVKGYHAIIVMPETTSREKVKMMQTFGAELVFTSTMSGISGTVEKAKELAKDRGAFFLNQFENPDNVRSHLITGKEILKQTKALDIDGIDAFVAGVGTGGTLVGVAKVLKEKNLKTKTVAVEPEKVPAFYNVLYKKELKVEHGIAHRIEGIGEGFVPKNLMDNRDFVDDAMLVKDEDAINTVRALAKKEGIFAGPSSGANVWAALKLTQELGEGKIIVTVIPDTGQRYLSSSVFEG